MSRKNAWKSRVYELLEDRAMSSTELSHKLKETHRYNPHARKINSCIEVRERVVQRVG